VRGPRARPSGKRCFTFQAVLHGMAKEVVGHGVIIRERTAFGSPFPDRLLLFLFGGLTCTCTACAFDSA
jgi:hypothetical protein